MRKKIVAAAVLAVVLLVAGFAFLQARSDQRRLRVGLVNPNPRTGAMTEGFVAGLAELGYRQGKNIDFIRCEDEKEMAAAIKAMAARPVALIFAVTTPAAKAAAAASSTIPVVFILNDPVKSGLVTSLGQPSANLTGIQVCGSTAKALEWLLAVAPGRRHIFVPIKYDTEAARQCIADLQEAATRLAIQLTVVEVATTAELDQALAAMPAGVDALFAGQSLFIGAEMERIVRVAIAGRLPVFAAGGKYEDGVLLSFGPDRFQAGRQASRLAHRLLQGERVADVPTELADFFLGVNLQTARAMGLEIPSNVLLQASHVVR